MSSQCRSRKARVSLESCLISASLCDASEDTFRLDTAEASLEEQGQWHVDSCGHLADQCPPNPTEFIGLVPLGQKGRMLFFFVPGALSSRFPRINHPGSVGTKAGFRGSGRYRFPPG